MHLFFFFLLTQLFSDLLILVMKVNDKRGSVT